MSKKTRARPASLRYIGRRPPCRAVAAARCLPLPYCTCRGPEQHGPPAGEGLGAGGISGVKTNLYSKEEKKILLFVNIGLNLTIPAQNEKKTMERALTEDSSAKPNYG